MQSRSDFNIYKVTYRKRYRVRGANTPFVYSKLQRQEHVVVNGDAMLAGRVLQQWLDERERECPEEENQETRYVIESIEGIARAAVVHTDKQEASGS